MTGEDASPTAIRVTELTTAYGSDTVHENLSLRVERGEVMGVIGPSGTGKSVLLRAIIGLKRPEAGDIRVLGKDPWTPRGRAELQQSWGVMFQDGALFSNMTVLENAMVPLIEHVQLPKTLARDIAAAKIGLAGLDRSSHDKLPSDLSGGMRKRAALARALAADPQLLFLDEPTAGLDPLTAEGFDALIRELKAAMGLTVFLVTHDLDTLAATCDRIAVLGEKRVKEVGALQELRASNDPWIDAYFNGARGRGAAPADDGPAKAQEG